VAGWWTIGPFGRAIGGGRWLNWYMKKFGTICCVDIVSNCALSESDSISHNATHDTDRHLACPSLHTH
jgi:hypothetical protein